MIEQGCLDWKRWSLREIEQVNLKLPPYTLLTMRVMAKTQLVLDLSKKGIAKQIQVFTSWEIAYRYLCGYRDGVMDTLVMIKEGS